MKKNMTKSIPACSVVCSFTCQKAEARRVPGRSSLNSQNNSKKRILNQTKCVKKSLFDKPVSKII